MSDVRIINSLCQQRVCHKFASTNKPRDMKTLASTFSFLFILTSSTLLAQTSNYDLVVQKQVYKHLSGATKLNGTGTWNDPQFEINIGFDFPYFDSTFSKIYFDDIALGGELHELVVKSK